MKNKTTTHDPRQWSQAFSVRAEAPFPLTGIAIFFGVFHEDPVSNT